MKMSVLMIAGVVALAGLGVVAWAADGTGTRCGLNQGGGCSHRGMSRMRGADRGPGRQVLQYAKTFDLTEEQIKAIEAIREERMAGWDERRTVVRDAMQAMWALRHAEAVDEEAVRAAGRAVGEAMAEMALYQQKTRDLIHEQLTEKQNELAKLLFAARQERREYKMQRWHGRGEMGGKACVTPAGRGCSGCSQTETESDE